MRSQKLDTYISFPKQRLDMSPYTSSVLRRSQGERSDAGRTSRRFRLLQVFTVA
eukprot:COSAG01_NODE_2376_length_7801_cov_20.055700_5_plen_54_part_00